MTTDTNYFPFYDSTTLITHTYYSLSYNQMYRQAEWVYYEISKETAFGSVKRTNSFRQDPLITGDQATLDDYSHSGYDRGHLCPAGSMAFNQVAMKESFYLSNMSPQSPSFNRGIWKKLETQVRTWGYENGNVIVVTGPVLTIFIDTIGTISVPKYYYKVILDFQQPELKAIGFILENKASSEHLTKFSVTIDSVEQLTGLDFFYAIPDSLEDELESHYDSSKWTWKPMIPIKGCINTSQQYTCIALTKSQNRCSRSVADSNQYCWQHQQASMATSIPLVWLCGDSKIYHTSPSHGSLKNCKSNILQITIKEAEKRNLRPCKCKDH